MPWDSSAAAHVCDARMHARSPRYVRLVRLSPLALAPPHATAAMRRFKLVTFFGGHLQASTWLGVGHGGSRPPWEAHVPTGGDPGCVTTARAYEHMQAMPVRLVMFPDGQSWRFPHAWVPPPGVRCFLSKLAAHTSSISKRTPKPGSRWRPNAPGTGFGGSF